MSLTPEQKQAVASWIAAGDNLSAVQKKLIEQFKLSMTYRDVRFLVDDLNLELKDPAPKVDATDATKAAPPRAGGEKKGAADKAKEKPAASHDAHAQDEFPEDNTPGEAGEPMPEDELPPEGDTGGVRVDVDHISLIPGAVASGSVTFSDGVTGRWMVDQYGRPGFTEVSVPGYRPKPEDAQEFMRALSMALQKRGM